MIAEDARRGAEAGRRRGDRQHPLGRRHDPEYVGQPELAAASTFVKPSSPTRLGITAIVGQGPHVVQQIERIGGKFVVFSEGNLISNQGPEPGSPRRARTG